MRRHLLILATLALAAKAGMAAFPAADLDAGDTTSGLVRDVVQRARDGARLQPIGFAAPSFQLVAGRVYIVQQDVVDLRSSQSYRLDKSHDDDQQSQVLRGERVKALEAPRGDWVYVAALDQPSHKNPDGYPGLLPVAALSADPALAGPNKTRFEQANDPRIRAKLIQELSRFVGIDYLWGGRSEQVGMDCSGLFSLGMFDLGYIVSRDAVDQASEFRIDVGLDQMKPGDLIFLKNLKGRIHHVAVYYGQGLIIEAPETGEVVHVMPLKDRIEKAASDGDQVIGRKLIPD
jgi:hypothetical protein